MCEEVSIMDEKINNEESAILHLLGKINRIIRCEMIKASQDIGFTHTQMIVLKTIWEKQPTTLSVISAEIGLSNSTTSGIIDRLVNHGVVHRQRSQSDRRIVYLTLTAKAKELKEKMHSSSKNFFNNLFADVSKEEKIQMLDALQKLYSILSEISPANCCKG